MDEKEGVEVIRKSHDAQACLFIGRTLVTRKKNARKSASENQKEW